MKAIIFFLLFALNFACVSIEYQSTYNQQSKTAVKKIAIISQSVENKGFINFFSKELAQKALEKKIEVLPIVRDSLSFGTQAQIDQQVNLFSPDIVIEIKKVETSPSKNWQRTNYNSMDGTYYLGVKQKGSDEIYWKSLIKVINENNIYNSQAGQRGYSKNEYTDLIPKRASEILAKIIQDSK